LQKTALKLSIAWRASPEPPFSSTQSRDHQAAEDYSTRYISLTKIDPPDVSDVSLNEVSPDPSLLQTPSHEPEDQSVAASLVVTTPESGAATQGAHYDASQSPDTDDRNVSDTVRDLLMTLSVRGTGKHQCPHQHSCKKGGVKNGNIVTFERNSAFRSAPCLWTVKTV
jgi:hypothetical protein